MTLSNGDTAELSEENGWKATLSVPKFDNLGEITYTWAEETVRGYALTNSAYDEQTRTTTLTNSHTPEVTSVTVRKEWRDEDDRDRMRPDSVTAVLSNGMTVVLNADNQWSGTVNGLPKYSEGKPIDYTWTEENVDGYELQISGSTLINIHEPETTFLTVRKVWNDNDNQDGIRPASVRATLYGNNTPVGSVTLDESNEWSATIGNLFVHEAGEEIDYRWEEEDVPGYVLTQETRGGVTTLTNTHTPETIDLTVSKVWDDNENQDGMRPGSLRVDLSNGQRVSLNAANEWTQTVTDLPRYASGEEIEYTWTEEAVRGYEQTGSVTNDGRTVITNRHETLTTVATVVKAWNDDGNRDGLRPRQVTVTLSDGQQVTLSDENNWMATITGLPAYADGKEIEYTWTEENVPGYTAESDAQGTTTILTNTHAVETVDLTVTKAWNDGGNQDGIRPDSVQATLYGNDTPVGSVTLNENNGWSAAIRNLPVREAGEEITYRWEEENVTGYIQTQETRNGVTTLTNTHTPETAALTVTKVWNDNDNQDGIRPDRLRVTLNNGDQVILNAENHWTAVIENLPVYENGERINYAWTEENTAGYTLTDSRTEGNVTTLTNTHAPAVTTLTVTKVWADDEDRDALRPSALRVELLANGETVRQAALNSANGWTASFGGMPVYENGREIVYAWAEEDVPGYELTVTEADGVTTLTNTHKPETVTLTVRKTWNDDENRDGLRPESLQVTLLGDDETERTLTLSNENGWTASIEAPAHERGRTIRYTWTEASIASYTGEQVTEGNTTTFTNTHVPATTARTIVKRWEDADNQDGLRPEQLTVYLLANQEVMRTVVLSEENQWTYTAEDLHVYDHGEAVSYAWREDAAENYPTLNTSVSGTVTTFTNVHEPILTTLRVQKVWDDANNMDGLRPASLTVALTANGRQVGSVTLSGENAWTDAIEDLPVYENGRAIEYLWTEENVEGYTATSSQVGNTTVLTNTHNTDRTVATVVKVWDDDDDRDGLRPASLTVTLSTGDAVILTAENNWTGTVGNLPRYRNGNEIEYTWTEETVAGYTLLSAVTDGTVTTLVNRHEIALQELTVVKVWDDDGNRDGLRPNTLTATLNNTWSVTLNEGNAWTGRVADVPVYADGGRVIIYRWTENAVPGYILTRTTDNAVTTLTNTHVPETVSLTVRKVWVDEESTTRPPTLNMVLTGSNGETRMVTLSAATGWEATINNLPRYADGSEITYTWTEPAIAGYTQTSAVTTGTTTVFTNTRVQSETPPAEYTLTVNYRYLDGGTAAPTYPGTYSQGDPYNVVSPEIDGYRATLIRVTGVMPARDVEYTVIYMPIDETILIEDIDTPLGLGDSQVFLNIDDCLE